MELEKKDTPATDQPSEEFDQQRSGRREPWDYSDYLNK